MEVCRQDLGVEEVPVGPRARLEPRNIAERVRGLGARPEPRKTAEIGTWDLRPREGQREGTEAQRSR